MYTYDVCTPTDREIFHKALRKLEGIEGFSLSGEILEDVDESLIAKLNYKGSQVLLKNDEQVGTLYIESDADIEHLIYT